jgi:transcriptional regulator
MFISNRREMAKSRTDILQGTLDLLVLKTLETLGPRHGWGIARRIEQVSNDVLFVNQGTLYPALIRLEQRGWIKSKWGVSENNRRAKFYSLTKSGTQQLEVETANWEEMVNIVGRVLRGAD